MGNCMSSNGEDGEQKKRSQLIDRTLEEDSKKLRRECKILLLGEYAPCFRHTSCNAYAFFSPPGTSTDLRLLIGQVLARVESRQSSSK